jgi:hypothetical protein
MTFPKQITLRAACEMELEIRESRQGNKPPGIRIAHPGWSVEEVGVVYMSLENLISGSAEQEDDVYWTNDY